MPCSKNIKAGIVGVVLCCSLLAPSLAYADDSSGIWNASILDGVSNVTNTFGWDTSMLDGVSNITNTFGWDTSMLDDVPLVGEFSWSPDDVLPQATIDSFDWEDKDGDGSGTDDFIDGVLDSAKQAWGVLTDGVSWVISTVQAHI